MSWADWGDSSASAPTSTSTFSNHRNSFSSSNGPSLPTNIKIEGFDDHTTVTEIRCVFGRFGRITSAVFSYPLEHPNTKCSCWLTYETPESCETAIRKFNHRELRGREVTVTTEAPPFTPNGKGGGGGAGFGISNGGSFGGSNGFGNDSFSGGGPIRNRPGGGGGGRPCYNCNKEGHMARECPDPKRPRDSNRSQPYGGRGGGGDRRPRFNANETPLGGGGDAWGAPSTSGGGDSWGAPSAPSSAPSSSAATAVDTLDDWGGSSSTATVAKVEVKPESAPPAPAAAAAAANDEGW